MASISSISSLEKSFSGLNVGEKDKDLTGLTFLDKSAVSNPYDEVCNINKTLDDKTWMTNDTPLIYHKYIKKQNSVVFDFVKNSGKIVGYIIARPDYDDPKAAYLSYMAINKSVQKIGIGSKILQSTIEKIKGLSYKKLTFECESINVKFYEKFAEKNKMKFESKDLEYDFANGNRKFAFTYFLS